jgi:hypothetical protein
MSGLVNKIKEAVHSDKKDNAATDNPQSSNAGPHASNMANKADPRVDSDRDNYGTTNYGTTGTHGTTNAGYGSTNAGPHDSNIANKADPRVDSDRDGRGIGHGTAGTTGGIGSTGAGYGSTGTSGLGSTGTYGSTNAGPHSSNMANKADPRVDSDRDGRGIGHGTAGNAGGIGSTGAGYGSTGTSGIGSTGTTGAGYGSTNAGPHSSNIANKADPRVDSDLVSSHPKSNLAHANKTQDGGRSTGFGTSGTGHGDRTGYNQGTTGSGLGGHGVSATPGSGDASKTAGPHNSNLLNKLDPRVDSDMDGSKTMGGNATHQ